MKATDLTIKQKWIDIAKGMAILMIITRHSGIGGITYQMITAFDLPLFFFISGYLFHFEKYRLNPHLFVYKKLKRLLLPYFATSIIAFMLYFIYYGNFPKNSASLLISFLKGNPVLDVAAMWFLPALFVGEITLFSLSYIDSRNSRIALMCCLLTAIAVFSDPSLWMSFWNADRVAVYMIFMYGGYLYSKLDYKISLKVVISALFIFLIFFQYNYKFDLTHRTLIDLTFFFISGWAGILVALFIAQNVVPTQSILSKLFSFLGTYTIIILAFQFINLNYISRIATDLIHYPLPKVWAIKFILLSTSVIIILFIKKSKVLMEIYGIKSDAKECGI